MIATTFDIASLRSKIEAELAAFGVPGMELAVVHRGEVVFAGGFGTRAAGQDLPVTADTVFAHGSTGKAFTSFLVGTLVDDGLLEWDRPVRDYLPDLRFYDPVTSDRLTVRDLLCHRSGVIGWDLVWLANPDLDRAELVRRIRHMPPFRDFRQSFLYFNLGYVAAGYLAGVVANSTFEAEVQKRILDPLGMTRTYMSAAEVTSLDDFASGHVTGPGGPVVIPHQETASMTPAGGIHSCATDTARWLLCLLNEGRYEERSLISPATLREIQSTQIAAAGVVVPQGVDVHGYGLGWIVATYRGRRHLAHGGGIHGFATRLELVPSESLGVAVSVNAQSPLAGRVASHVVDLLLGVDESDPSLAPLGTPPSMPQAPAQAGVESSPPARPPSGPLSDFQGEYGHPALGLLTVEPEDDGLAARLGAIEKRLRHRQHDTWEMLLPEHQQPPLELTFIRDGRGAVGEVRGVSQPLLNVTFERRR